MNKKTNILLSEKAELEKQIQHLTERRDRLSLEIALEDVDAMVEILRKENIDINNRDKLYIRLQKLVSERHNLRDDIALNIENEIILKV